MNKRGKSPTQASVANCKKCQFNSQKAAKLVPIKNAVNGCSKEWNLSRRRERKRPLQHEKLSEAFFSFSLAHTCNCVGERLKTLCFLNDLQGHGRPFGAYSREKWSNKKIFRMRMRGDEREISTSAQFTNPTETRAVHVLSQSRAPNGIFDLTQSDCISSAPSLARNSGPKEKSYWIS